MRRHALDSVSLVFGFAFTAAGVLFFAGQLDQAVRLRWLWPVLLLALGLGILLDLGTRREQAPAEPADPEVVAAEPEAVESAAAEPAVAEPVAAEPVAAEPGAPEAAEADRAAAPTAERTTELHPGDPADRDR
jgi:hypothetical protein